MQVRGKTVLLTGATGGIGHAIARQLHTEGAGLVLTGRRVDELGALANELSAKAIAADLTQPEDLSRILEEAGPVDILVANAGVPADGHLTDFSVASLDEAIAVNLRAPMLMAHQLTPAMRQRGSGHIVFIGSIGGRVSAADTAVYNATKFGLRGFARGLRQDLYGTGIGVSLVDPGFIRDAGVFANSGATLPRGFRTYTPQQVARAVIRAIERDRAETIVAPVETRLAVAFGSLAPELNATVQRRLGMSLRSEPVGAAGAGHFDGEDQNTRAAANISWRASDPPGTPT